MGGQRGVCPMHSNPSLETRKDRVGAGEEGGAEAFAKFLAEIITQASLS